MPNSWFQFKQFTVFHNQCAMKVGTDGVLLGAWVNCLNARSILDVGTGSGLIALMLAQRSGASITGIDLDEGAYNQAVFNVAGSPFSGRIEVAKCNYLDYSPGCQYDLIVSNPPYFTASLKSPDAGRSFARHNDELPLNALIQKSAKLLSTDGKLALILPVEYLDDIVLIAGSLGLNLIRKMIVKPRPDLPPKRVLLEFSTGSHLLVSEEMSIETDRHVYSNEFISLVKDFYIKM